MMLLKIDVGGVLQGRVVGRGGPGGIMRGKIWSFLRGLRRKKLSATACCHEEAAGGRNEKKDLRTW